MKSGYSKMSNVGKVSELNTDNPWLFLDIYSITVVIHGYVS